MLQNNASLLIVDDDPELRDLLNRYLSEQGFKVNGVGDAIQMDEFLSTAASDLVILDLMLPGEDGLSIAKRLRGKLDIPILMLSARGDDVDRIVGLEVGADDYLAKPFNPRELLARIRALLRRPHDVAANHPAENSSEVYTFGPYRLDSNAQELYRGDTMVPLTAGEYALLKIFVENPNRVLSRDRLIDMLKGYDRSPYDRSVDVRVNRLRRKIEDEPSSPQYIRTAWGEGYRFFPAGASKEA